MIFADDALSRRNVAHPSPLQIVPHAEIDQANFYTMSSSGVTHFVDGGVEFTPLDQWEREYHLFNQISQLNVFRMYKLWKGWAMWKRFVCKRKQRIARAQLEKQLFFLNPIFQRSLKRLRELCYALSVLRLHDLEPGTLYTLEAFVAKQREQQQQVEARLVDFSASTVQTVYEACDSAMKQLEERLFGRQGAGEDEAAATAAGHGPKHGAAALHNKIKSEGEGNQFSYAITAARRSEQRRLLNYIRLADYMVCDTLHVLLVDSVSDILGVVRHLPLEAVPLPQVPAAHEPASAESHPAKDDKGAAGKAGDKKLKDGDKKLEQEAPPAEKKRRAVFQVEVFLEHEQLVFSPSSDQFSRKVSPLLACFRKLWGWNTVRLWWTFAR